MRLFRFYWENFDLIPKALALVLKPTGLMRRARENALRCRLQERDLPIGGLPSAFDGYRILHFSDLHIDEILDGGERLCQIVTGLVGLDDAHYYEVHDLDRAMADVDPARPCCVTGAFT
jgi:hypothetical protein